MSTIIMTQCWPLQGMSATHKAVLISLADNANDEGVCWPSVQRISERTCLSERAVRNALRWLEEVGLLTSHQRAGRSTWYTVTPASYAPGTTCPPAPDAAPPRHDVPPTPAPGAPRTVKEPSGEPSVGANAPAAKPAKRSSFGLTNLLADNPHGASEQVLADWLTCREKLRATVTATVWKRVNAELAKCAAAGIAADDALAEAQEAGWRGFKCEWVLNRLNTQTRQESRSAGPNFDDTSWADDLGDL